MDLSKLAFFLPEQAEEWARGGVVLAVGLAVAFLLWRAVVWLFTRPGVKGQPWAEVLRRPVGGAVFWGLALKSVGLAAEELTYLQQNAKYADLLSKTLALAWLAFVAIMALRFVLAVFPPTKDLTSDPTTAHRSNLFRKLSIGVVCVFAALFALRILGMDTTPLLAGGAVGGLIVGLALQESLSNVFSGILFSMDESVRVGDLVRLGDNQEGYVQRIGWRTTLIKLWDDSLLVVPNSQIGKEKIINLSYPALPFVVNVDFGVAYDSDLEKVEAVCLGVARQVQSGLTDSPDLRDPYVRWQGFRDSSIGVKVFLPVPSPDVQYRAKSEMVKALHRALGEQGIVVPNPIITLRPMEPVPAPET
ncbi:MAG: mechanosensitive ion channel family protein [Fimbriimonadaceae bacterium]|nr:mechanosensitive ion channel family protein [Fimbriimonadaceae bacterium]QYK58523.1 MAG: mechanosensitive ion channel family protein [Fimbriimonadaceae bacterium]